jgi:hypothetical protein
MSFHIGIAAWGIGGGMTADASLPERQASLRELTLAMSTALC